jgi:hypothetical protein
MFLYQHHVTLNKRTSNVVDEVDITSTPFSYRQLSQSGYMECFINTTEGTGYVHVAGTDVDGGSVRETFATPPTPGYLPTLGDYHFASIVGVTATLGGSLQGTVEIKAKRKDGTPVWMDKSSVTIRCRLREMRVRPNYSLIIAGIATINDLLMYFPRILPEADKPEKGDYFTYSGSTYEVLNTDEINEGGPNLETGVALCRKPSK